MDEIVALVHCRRCGQDKIPHKEEGHLCEDCAKVENSRVSYYRQHNFNWMDIAAEAQIEVWERQPQETDREWQVWLAFRDSYPSIKPTYKGVAEQVGTTHSVVKKVGQRWTFPARMQAWAKHCDTLTMNQRVAEVVGMNKRHIDMAMTLQDKLKTAIEALNPYELAPKDITALFKLTAELERKARMDDMELIKPTVVDDSPDLKKVQTKTEDLGDVIAILSKAGLIAGGQGAAVGVKKTVTTEVIVREDV